MYKICTKCGIEKDLSEFYKNTIHKDGLQSHCKACSILYSKHYSNQHKEKSRKANKRSYYKNKDKRQKYSKEYYDTVIREKMQEFPEIYLLKSIEDRCNNPNSTIYKYYGLKNIKNFLTLKDIRFLMERDNYDQIKRPSIERKNSKGHYTLENCEFIDRGENTARRNKEHCSKPILQYDLQGNFIKEWKEDFLKEIESHFRI